MKRYFITSVLFFGLIVGHAQVDTSKTREISFGISIIPPFYPGQRNSWSGNMRGLGIHVMDEQEYALPVNINYRFSKNNKGKNNLSFIAVVPIKNYSELSYYAISYGWRITKLNKEATFSLNGDLLIGYLKYNGWGVGGMFTYPKYYEGADLLLTGVNIGFTTHCKLSTRLFLENEIYFLAYYASGNLYYNDYATCKTCTGIEKGSKIGITLSKLLSINLGYKL